jgi:predicted adenylyl cyclase CyaB
MQNIECEIRSFITKEQFEKLLDFFNKNALLCPDGATDGQADEQITYYLSREGKKDCDLRIQQNKNYSKIWMKKGKIHDESREEIEVKCKRGDFEKLEKLFLTLGYKIEIKWFRARYSFKWDDIDVSLDYTRGYGYIIELEKKCSEDETDKTADYLKSKMAELGVALTSREEFDKKYLYYKENWRNLV